jgi:NADH-quinone oxidoreductase subunit F
MTVLGTMDELEALRRSLIAERDPNERCITVCGGTGCRANGSDRVLKEFERELQVQGLATEVKLAASGCHGFCEQGPVVVIRPDAVFYRRVQPEDVAEIVSETVKQGRIVDGLLYVDPTTGRKISHEHEVPFYQLQRRVVLDQNGIIEPTEITDYIAAGGYGSLAKVLREMSPAEVVAEISAAKLRGRGGAGFPTGLKWNLCRQAPGDVKYIVCNADEGDPGAYMDRSIMEGNPHRVLEGMLIGAYAIGAHQGIVYIRNEYPLAVKHLRTAIQQSRECGLLGSNVLGSGFDFDVALRLGSGAFVCGEETALMASIEGRIGEPRSRPPYPAQSGLWGRPTNINNVETWANVPVIIEKGAEWYAALGTEASGGTKIFSQVGKINNTGLVEVPIGTTLGEIIMDIGGGIPNGKRFKAAQLGGPSGGCVPKEHLNVPIDYASLIGLGAIMGSGGLVVCDEDTCMVDLARYFLTFVQEESCGKCVPCRVGTRAMLETLERICAGQGQESDLDYLMELAQEIKRSSLCGLGQTAPNPVLTTLRYFRDEYEAHIREKRCPAGVCQGLFVSPCQNACPLGMDVPRYVSLIGEERFQEALAVILDTNPFPAVCGRVCDHRCELKCRRGELDQPVAIRELKRFVADIGLPYPNLRVAEQDGQPKVAVVGSGPAGLSCAYFLARLGYRPTVFEKLPVPGGMLAVGIPEYRLPKQVLQREIAAIESLGVEIRTSTTVGEDVTLPELQARGYKAFFLAPGAQMSRPLEIPGEDLQGFIPAISFLRDLSLNGNKSWVGQRVAVIGGGNAAIDAARCALRLGADNVSVLYRRTKQEMPAQKQEIEAAEREGVDFHFLVTPAQILGNGNRVYSVECQRMRLGTFGRDGRRKPIPLEGSSFSLGADMVIPAIGQSSDTADIVSEERLQIRPAGLIVADKHGRTSVPGLFAGGDATSGPATVVEAIAAGERAAVAIDRYLRQGRSNSYPWRLRRPADSPFDPNAEPVKHARCQVPELAAGSRCNGFDEVQGGLATEAAVREAHRCLRCDYGKLGDQSDADHD